MPRVLSVTKALLLSAAILTIAGSVKSQSVSKDRSPQEVYELAMEATKALDYERFASYMHPEGLAQIKDMMWPIIEAIPVDSLSSNPLTQLFGVKYDENGLVPMTPSEFFVSFLKGLSILVPDFETALSQIHGEVIGEVPEGDTLVHIVARTNVDIGTVSLTKMEITSFKRNDDRWMMMMSGDFEGLARRLSQQFSK